MPQVIDYDVECSAFDEFLTRGALVTKYLGLVSDEAGFRQKKLNSHPMIRSAATFIAKSCRQITDSTAGCLSVSIASSVKFRL